MRELAVSYDKDSSKGSDSTTVEPDAAVATEKAADEIAIDSGNAAAIKSKMCIRDRTYAIDPAQSRSCWCATRTIRWRPSSI